MRQIKFRGFNPATNEIVTWEGMQGWSMRGLESPNIMQFTGLFVGIGSVILGMVGLVFFVCGIFPLLLLIKNI